MTFSVRRCGFWVAWAGCVLAARAQNTDPVQLEPVVTTANGFAESSATVGTTVDLVSGADLAREQLASLADAFQTVPSMPIFQAGQMGSSASLFLRGANSDQVLFLVDGIRFNDANTDYGPFLGSWRITGAEQLEIARGPQSTLYGGGASGGVVSLTTAEGRGAPSEWISVEGGDFDTIQGSAGAQGQVSGWAYNAQIGAGRTDNERENNDFTSGNLALRLDKTLGAYVSIGATVRALDAKYGDPGDIYTDNLYDYETEKDLLGTVYANILLTQYVSFKLTVGGQDRQFVSAEPSPGEPTVTSTVDNDRGVFDGQFVGQLTQYDKLIAGYDWEQSHTSDNGFGAIDRSEGLIGVYVEDEAMLLENLYLTGGYRYDDYSTYGSANTGRATLAWLSPQHVIKLRASYGSGFNSPSFLDLYGQAPGYAGNPNLKAEWSHGWDAGFDFYLPDDPTQVLSITLFQTNFSNLIEDDFNVDPATTVNVDRARTEGLEVAWTTRFAGAIQAKIGYTYLLSEDVTDNVPLPRRPRDSGGADLFLDMKNGWTFGAGGQYVGRHADIDALSFDPVADPGYTVIRAYAQWQINRHLSLHVHVENALNASYSPVNGYPGEGRGIFGGARWNF